MWPVALGIGVIGTCLLFPSRSEARARGGYMIPAQASVKIFRRHPAHQAGVVIHHKHPKKKHHVHAYDQFGNYHRR